MAPFPPQFLSKPSMENCARGYQEQLLICSDWNDKLSRTITMPLLTTDDQVITFLVIKRLKHSTTVYSQRYRSKTVLNVCKTCVLLRRKSIKANRGEVLLRYDANRESNTCSKHSLQDSGLLNFLREVDRPGIDLSLPVSSGNQGRLWCRWKTVLCEIFARWTPIDSPLLSLQVRLQCLLVLCILSLNRIYRGMALIARKAQPF